MATGGGNPLRDKDISKVADIINCDHAMKIALQYLDLSKNEIDQARAIGRARDNPVHDYHFDLIHKWKCKKGPEGTRENLHACLDRAGQGGLLERTAILFLLDKENVKKPGPKPPVLKPLSTPIYQNREKKPQAYPPPSPPKSVPFGVPETLKESGKFSLTAPVTGNPKVETGATGAQSEVIEIVRSQNGAMKSGSRKPHAFSNAGFDMGEAEQTVYKPVASPVSPTAGEVGQKVYEDTELKVPESPDTADGVPVYESKSVSLKHAYTFGTELANWEGTKFCRMENENTVIYGKKNEAADTRGPGIYVYSKEGKKKKRLEDVCEHKEGKGGNIISVKIENNEYILISCVICKKMFLLNTETGKYYLSYENKDFSLGPMCKGNPNEIYVAVKTHQDASLSIYVLNINNKRFIRSRSFDTELKKDVCAVAHIASVELLLLLESESRKTVAVSGRSGETQWVLDDKIVGIPYTPECLVTYSRYDGRNRYNSILTADGSEKLMIFSTKDGKFKHDLRHAKFSNIHSIQCIEDTLVVQQSRQNAVAICFFTLNFDFESEV